jgi:hypothetical protein
MEKGSSVDGLKSSAYPASHYIWCDKRVCWLHLAVCEQSCRRKKCKAYKEGKAQHEAFG